MHTLPLLLLLVLPQQSDPPPASLNQRAVDYVSLRNQPPLFGVVLSNHPREGLTMAVQREWLQKAQPQQFEQALADERRRAAVQRSILIERLDEWMIERAGDDDLLAFLKEQQEVLKQPAPNAEDKGQFVFLKIPARQVRRVHQRGGERRQTALLAFRERLPNIETRSTESLAASLREKGVALNNQPVDLSDRVPPTGDTDQQWAARQAIIEHLYRKPVRLKGTPDLLVRDAADGQPADVNALIQKMLQGRVQSLLRDLTEGAAGGQRDQNSWRKQAIAEARKTDSRAVRVTLVQPDAAMTTPTVSSWFLARMPDGSWDVLWHSTLQGTAEGQPELEEIIRDDPQVSAILRTVGAAAGEEIIDRAIRFGAATMAGHRRIDESFFAWRHPYFDRLDSPAIRVER